MVTLTELKQKKQSPTKEKDANTKISKKRKSLKRFDRNLENTHSSTPKDLQFKDLEEEIVKLRKENKLLKSGTTLTKNEEKILSAIRSEKIEQGTNQPIISTSMLRKKYKVSAKYQGESIRSLISKSMIKRMEASYSGAVKTYRWTIVETH